MSTKEKILEDSLTLFSKQGYDGTSVEQIAQAVGIKAPSLYKHFKGKEEILNAIIDSAEARYEESFGSEKNIGKLPESKEEFVLATMGKLSFTMHDPLIRKIRMLLVQEQFRNPRFAQITTKHQMEGVQKMYERIIEGMMKKGLFIEEDPQMLSVELTGPAVLLIAKADREPQSSEQILKDLEKHIRHFCKVYMK